LAVRDPGIATQQLLKCHEKYAAWDPLLSSRELAIVKQQEKYTIQDPGTASQELAKWQETYAIRDPETAKHEKGKRRNKRDCQTYGQRKKTEETDRQYL
jgi:NACalpha-BTF3-like transcription factor